MQMTLILVLAIIYKGFLRLTSGDLANHQGIANHIC